MKRVNDMTIDELHEFYRLLRTDPKQFLLLVEQYLQRYPDDPAGYDMRADAWEVLGQFGRALDDMNESISRRPTPWAFQHRALIYRAMGRYEDAIGDLNSFEAMAPEEWRGSFAPLFRADCHASLGNEMAALADCDQLPHNHWTPGMYGTPAGNRQSVIQEIKRRARLARVQPR